ncbi:MAG: polyprenol monophosphomannose synthase [Myxococcota bacterium]|nr:polyprenol monophosphomannose synthase [Myxococcota bacterium]
MASALIITPTYNERDNLDAHLSLIHEHLPEAHILIVDDASPDGTGALADEYAAKDERIHVLHRQGKEGLGRAYLAGFEWALERDYERIFEMDADLSHPAEALPRLLEATERVGLSLGSRWVKGGGVVGWPIKRKLLSLGGSLYARMILGVKVRDLTGGFKCFRREVLEAIDFDAVATVGYGFQIELTWRALRAGHQVEEVPILFTDRIAGVSKMSSAIFLEALSLVWKLRLGLIT